jgi:hypothetical protein
VNITIALIVAGIITKYPSENPKRNKPVNAMTNGYVRAHEKEGKIIAYIKTGLQSLKLTCSMYT